MLRGCSRSEKSCVSLLNVVGLAEVEYPLELETEQ